LLDFHDLVGSASMKPPKWLQPKRAKKGEHHAIACGILSDCHFDEVVRAEEIGFQNCFDRRIGTLRLEKWAQGFVKQGRDYLSGVAYDGAVVCLGGDIFSGNLHDLSETNEDTQFGSLLYWCEQICAALSVVADFYGSLYVPVVVGNHGRMTFKPRTKLRARDNLDWLLGHMIAKHFANDDRITVSVEDDADAFFDVYDTTFLLTHGDQVTGGSGVGGIWPPIMRMLGRKQTRYSYRPFETMIIGHWHQLIMAPAQGLIVNGSIKGYDEFASLFNLRPERPQQAMWLVTPENGTTWSAPVFCDDRTAEGW